MIRHITATLTLLMAASFTHATPFNPDPAGYNEDAGAAYALPLDTTFSLEGLDPLDGAFGFYFASAPTGLIEIFGAEDTGSGQSAVIDFSAGTVFDSDVPEVQDVFAATSDPGLIGFWYMVAGITLYSDPAFNGGIDLAGIFEKKDDPFTFLIAFEDPASGPLLINVVSGAVPVPVGIPVPLSLLLLLTALPFVRRRRD